VENKKRSVSEGIAWYILNRATSLALVTAAGVVIVYSLIIVVYGPAAEVWAWFSVLLGTLVSVGGALVIGRWLFGYQTRVADDKRREELRELLIAELEDTKKDWNT
jgi:Kef-type K+ transport system membrane component KefB